MIFPATIKQGQLLTNKEKIQGWASKQKDGKYVLSIEEANLRSAGANNYYWLCLGTIAESTGHTKNELHEIYKRKFLPQQSINYRGEKIGIATTTRLKKGEFTEYMMNVKVEAAELGVILPSVDN